jgi:uncharacterized membrane protein
MTLLFVLLQCVLQVIVPSFEQHVDDAVVLEVPVFVKVIPNGFSDIFHGFFHNVVYHHDTWYFSIIFLKLVVVVVVVSWSVVAITHEYKKCLS